MRSRDVVEDRTPDGRKCRVPTVIDAFTGEAQTMRVDRRLSSTHVVDMPTDPVILRGPPARARPDDGPGFVARAVRVRIGAAGATTACTEPDSPRENEHV